MNRQQRRARPVARRRTQERGRGAPESSEPDCAVGPALAWRIARAA